MNGDSLTGRLDYSTNFNLDRQSLGLHGASGSAQADNKRKKAGRKPFQLVAFQTDSAGIPSELPVVRINGHQPPRPEPQSDDLNCDSIAHIESTNIRMTGRETGQPLPFFARGFRPLAR